MAIDFLFAPAMIRPGQTSTTGNAISTSQAAGIFTSIPNAPNLAFNSDARAQRVLVGVSTQTVIRAVTPAATRHAGVRVYPTAWTGSNGTITGILRFHDGTGVVHVGIGISNTGVIAVYRNTTATILGQTAAGVVTAGVEGYLAADVTISDTVGVVRVLWNGTEVLNITGADTRNAGLAEVGQVAWGSTVSTSVQWHLSDFYVGTATGDAPTSAVPDLAVDWLVPTAAGTDSAWTPNTGSALAAVTHAASDAPDEDTTYIASGTPAARHLFTLSDVPTDGDAVYAVQPMLRARKDDAGALTVAGAVRTGGTTSNGTAADPGTSYAWVGAIRTVNPVTGVAWTVAEIQALEAGAVIG